MAFLFKYIMPAISAINVEPTNICTLKCAGCARTRFIQQWPRHWQNHNLDSADLLRFLDIDLQSISVNFGGNYGDPIYHPDFIGMISEIKQRGARVSITTNGSHKKIDWWQELCDLLDSDDQIRFSIDGLPDSFTQYRENGDWESIESAIKTCTANPVTTVWKFIPFSFNLNEIDQAHELSRSLGMTDFLIDPSDRFDEKTSHLVPVHAMIGPRKQSQDQFKQNSTLAVDPKCHTGREHFISATGHYSPCCFVSDHRFYYKTQFGSHKEMYQIKNKQLSTLLQTPQVVDFFQNLDQNPPGVCQFNCPKI
jgi:MoaA/NifB/PqqE/SkfB family radical SAM enzyme